MNQPNQAKPEPFRSLAPLAGEGWGEGKKIFCQKMAKFHLLRSNILFALGLSTILFFTGCAPILVAGTTGGVLAVHDRRTLGTLIDDATLELKIHQALGKDRQLYRRSHISVVSYNNVILLTGQTPTIAFRDQAANMVKGMAKVRYVYNEIVVGPLSSTKQRAQDTWITTKIKAEMLTTRHLDPTRVKVLTDDGIVYLMGLVTPREARIATRIARQVHGVEKVTKIFEYIRMTSELKGV